MAAKPPTTDLPAPTTRDELTALMVRARAVDPAAVPALRRMVADPAVVAFLGGELAAQAERSFVAAIAGNDLGVREAVARKLELLRVELGGPAPAPVERLLVERVVACWLQVQDADLRYAQHQASLSLRQLDCYQRRMDAAHRRYVCGLKALVTVRKLAIPVLQVYVADRQVNVAGG